ncbi:MAG: helix-turn-helix transcriptional regulator [Clostridia bacterium]|nr:helix-turn-helix transcriptional regulator [Clostridia bacterium]
MNRIKQFRRNKKMSQSDIAKIIKVKQNTISQWEREIRMPNVRQALKLAEILETTVEDLYK